MSLSRATLPAPQAAADHRLRMLRLVDSELATSAQKHADSSAPTAPTPSKHRFR